MTTADQKRLWRHCRLLRAMIDEANQWRGELVSASVHAPDAQAALAQFDRRITRARNALVELAGWAWETVKD